MKDKHVYNLKKDKQILPRDVKSTRCQPSADGRHLIIGRSWAIPVYTSIAQWPFRSRHACVYSLQWVICWSLGDNSSDAFLPLIDHFSAVLLLDHKVEWVQISVSNVTFQPLTYSSINTLGNLNVQAYRHFGLNVHTYRHSVLNVHTLVQISTLINTPS